MKCFTEAEKQLLLSLDPFAGDEGSLRTLEDKVVVARKSNTCSNCYAVGKAGDEERVIKDVFDGDFQTHRYCAACCMALLRDHKNGGVDDAFYMRHERAITK